ncbi:MAG: hypothetical protein EPO11_10605 [Gammaproteobacteria bacterium]|nr:MAG: hypothetical protein EPO11_10605 [Gammaproteobacteria bacterium]
MLGIRREMKLKGSWPKVIFTPLFFALLAAALLAPIASETAIPNLGDYIIHLAAVIQAKMGWMEGQFPLRVMPMELSGWRYPFYQFSSPTTYMIAGLIYQWLTPANPLIAIKITIWLGLFLGGLYMNRLAYWLVPSKPAALLASVVYLFAPYHIIIVNHLGSLNEIVALGILPAALYYTLQRYYHPADDKTLLQLGFIWYLLITIHIVTFIYTSFFFAILFFLITCKNPTRFRSLLSVGTAYCFGCLLAIWFLAPIFLLEKYFILSSTYNNPAYLRLFHPFLSQLLFPAASITTGYKSSALMTIHPAVGWPIILAAGICFYAYLNRLSCGHKRADYWLPPLLAIFFIAFFMVWSPFNFWRWLPQPLLVAQHCWRLLSQVIWIGALLFAWAICWLFKNRLDQRHAIIGTLLIVMSANPWFPVSESAQINPTNFIQHPYLIYNEDAYLINFNHYTNFVDTIDSVLIYPTHSLKLNTIYRIPSSLLQLTVAPSIVLEGDLPYPMQLNAVVNHKILATSRMNSAHFRWRIPLNAVTDYNVNAPPLELMFTTNENRPAHLTIPTKGILLTGFFKPNEVLDIQQVQPHCQQERKNTVCTLTVPPSVHLVELPILYYPDLLSVTINGKSVPYQSVLYQGRLVTGIIPQPEQSEVIKVRFQGLPWANTVSFLAWGVWVLLYLFVNIRPYYD